MRRLFFGTGGFDTHLVQPFYLSVKFVFIVGICFSISTETFMPVDIRFKTILLSLFKEYSI